MPAQRILIAPHHPADVVANAVQHAVDHLTSHGVSGLSGPRPLGEHLLWTSASGFVRIVLHRTSAGHGVAVHSDDHLVRSRVLRAVRLRVPTTDPDTAWARSETWRPGSLVRLALATDDLPGVRAAEVRCRLLRHLASRQAPRRVDALRAACLLGWPELLDSIEAIAAERGPHHALATEALSACRPLPPRAVPTLCRWPVRCHLSAGALAAQVALVLGPMGPDERPPRHDARTFRYRWAVRGLEVRLVHDLHTGTRRLMVRGPGAAASDVARRLRDRFPSPDVDQLLAAATHGDAAFLAEAVAAAPQSPDLRWIQLVHHRLAASDRGVRAEARRAVKQLDWAELTERRPTPRGVRQVRGPGAVAA